MSFSQLYVNFLNSLKRNIKVDLWPVGRNTCRLFFDLFPAFTGIISSKGA